jgi:hypothetical protein
MATIVDSYSESNQDFSLGVPEETAGAIGQTFTGDGGTLNSVKFYLQAAVGLTGNCYARIYAHTGTWGTSGVPTGTALASSGVVDVSTIPTSSPSLVTFTFSGADKITLTNGTHYCVVFDSQDETAWNTSCFMDSSSATHSGNGFNGTESGWDYMGPGSGGFQTAYDICFYVYKDDATTETTRSGTIRLVGVGHI